MNRQSQWLFEAPFVNLTPSPMSNKPMLRRGSRGVAVVELQKLLTQKGFRLTPDGIFGSNTDAAVRNFQRSRGLGVDGIVGSNTWAALLSGSQTPVASPQPTYPPYGPTAPPPTNFKQRLKEIAEGEWRFFDFGKKKEFQDGAWQRVGQYWKEGVGHGDVDGRNRDSYWSAAFISWVIKTAGAGNRFKYSALHADYIRDTIQKRKTNDPNAAFKGYRLSEVAPQIGDLVCASRGKDAGKVGYDTTRAYESHCDIVVATRAGEIDVMGGNVIDSVSKKTLKVDAQGKLIPSQDLFVVIKNLL